MAIRRPIVLVSGVQAEMPRGDVIDTGLNVTLQANPSGLYFTGDNKLGFDGQGDNIQVIASGVGAVYRTVQDKLRDVVSVKDFGAVGDGVTNDTTAFTNAFAYLNAGTSPRKLYIPAGDYVVASGTCIITANYRSVFGDGFASRLLIPTTATPIGIQIQGTSNSIHITDVLISDLAVIANGWSGYSGNAISVNRADRCSVQRVLVSGLAPTRSWEQGIIFRDTNNGLIANNVVQHISGNGISLDLIIGSEITKNNLVVGNVVDFVGDAGIGFHNNIRYSSAVGNVISNPAQGGGTGIDVAGCQYCLFSNNNISNSGQYGIRLVQNLSYCTVDNVISGNTVEHPSTSTDPAIILADCNRNTVSGNTLLCNTAAKTNYGIYAFYTTATTQTHPITNEAIQKLTGSVIKDNTVSRFTSGLYLDAPGGLTSASFIVDNNTFHACTTGINFSTGSSEKRFTLQGHNAYNSCTTRVASASGGIVQNSDPLMDTVASLNLPVPTTGVETDALVTYLPQSTNDNQNILVNALVTEYGGWAGQLNVKDSAGSSIATEYFFEVTEEPISVVFTLAAADAITISIQKNSLDPGLSGIVSVDALSLTKRTFY